MNRRGFCTSISGSTALLGIAQLSSANITGEVSTSNAMATPLDMKDISAEEYAQALSKFPPDVQGMLQEIINSKENDFNGVILVEKARLIVDSLKQSVEQLMLDLLPLASLYARSPVSKFKVGAVSQGGSGNLYLGANMEFLGQPINLSIHAEQSSMNNAWLHSETGLSNLAVNYSPCGYCRQYLNELSTASKLKILLPNKPPKMLTDLLPDAFGPSDFGFKSGLMQAENHHLQLLKSSDDPVILAALRSASKSYVPYSRSYSGVALLTTDKKIYTGQYAENAAFNPSILPIQSALSNMNIGGKLYQNIERVVLVEALPSKSLCSQIDTTHSLLKSISTVTLEVAYIK